MSDLDVLFDNNRAWSKRMRAADTGFFSALAKQQNPKYLWIGCADSRVPANEILGLNPGEVFVHRNVANLVVHSDLNCLSVLQYAVEVLRVEHVMVVGHYGCGGVDAVAQQRRLGLAENWLRHLDDVAVRYLPVPAGKGTRAMTDALTQLNVVEQVRNVCRTTVLRSAWEEGRRVLVHGMVYSLQDGLLHPLVDHLDAASWRKACAATAQRLVDEFTDSTRAVPA